MIRYARRYERSNRTFEAAVQTLEKTFDAASLGAAALNRKIIDIAQRNLDLGFDLAKSLAGARTLSEIVELQAAYWQKQFGAFGTQAEEVRNRLPEFGTAKAKTAEPWTESIHHEPVKVAPPIAHETPRKRYISPARAPAPENLKLKPDTQKLEAPPPVGSGVRPLERQPPTRPQTRTAQGFAAEGGQ